MKEGKPVKIIDAHLHLFSNRTDWAEKKAQSVGHQNTAEHLRQAYEELGIVHGIIMGNGSLSLERHQYPEDLFHLQLPNILVLLNDSLPGWIKCRNSTDFLQ